MFSPFMYLWSIITVCRYEHFVPRVAVLSIKPFCYMVVWAQTYSFTLRSQ